MLLEELLKRQYKTGKEEGKIEGKIEDILEVLNELDPVSEELLSRIRQEKDIDRLKKMLKLAIAADSISAFEQQMDEM